MARDIDEDSGRPFIKVNHPVPDDAVRDQFHMAGYGTAFEGTISLRISDDGTVIAEGSTQGGSNGVIGEFKADLDFDRRPHQRLGAVEAFEESVSGSGYDRTWTVSRSYSASGDQRQAGTHQQRRGIG